MLCLRRPNNPFCRLCFAMLFFHPQIFFQLGLDFLAGLVQRLLMAHVCFHRRKWVHTRLSEKDRTQRLARRNRGISDGGRYHYPQTVLRGSETLRSRDLKRQTLPLLGLGRGCSRRTQKACGTAMRLCASLFRGVAAPLGCVIFFASAEIVACTPCAQNSLRV